ncbi:hypothetical protein [Halolactibacillus miurensis]|nr:hypothetical protein [Halolactibacillus miurensis]
MIRILDFYAILATALRRALDVSASSKFSFIGFGVPTNENLEELGHGML